MSAERRSVRAVSTRREGRRSRAQLKADIIRVLAAAEAEAHALPLHELKRRVWEGVRQYPGYATDLNEAIAGLAHDGVVWDDINPSRTLSRSRSPRVLTLSGLALDRICERGLDWVLARYASGR